VKDRALPLLNLAAVGFFAAVALGATNRAAHPGDAGERLLYGAAGLAAAGIAWALAGRPSKDVSPESPVSARIET
jgi:hypothetical protein